MKPTTTNEGVLGLDTVGRIWSSPKTFNSINEKQSAVPMQTHIRQYPMMFIHPVLSECCNDGQTSDFCTVFNMLSPTEQAEVRLYLGEDWPLGKKGSDPNFLRFGRTPSNNFLRFGKSNQAQNFLRFGRSAEPNFLRFGRCCPYSDNNIWCRFRRSHIIVVIVMQAWIFQFCSKNVSNVFAGRIADPNFLRFGKSAEPNFLRFGKRSDLGMSEPNFLRFGRNNFLRFGRNENDQFDREYRKPNFLRFGK
ncbi:unnamed protein product [Toxocara canis]|uniref:FMRFamide-like neuropeptides 1 n=1 Tax=Toxocara canis TaxID=6265 RepID=A0A183V1X1_TOXCA|nr:unnamed protein product [Toxocara canis]